MRELEGALNRVVAQLELVGRDISLESCQEVLGDLLRAQDRRVTISCDRYIGCKCSGGSQRYNCNDYQPEDQVIYIQHLNLYQVLPDG